MSGSLENTTSIFTGLRLNHIRMLLSLVTDQRVRVRRYIERRFLEHATEFDTTLAFLTRMDLVRDVGNNLSPTPSLHVDDDLSKTVLSRLAETNTQWRLELFAYLRHFRIRNDAMVHRPTLEQRSSESAIRNFLMELGAVTFDTLGNQYILTADNRMLFTQAYSRIAIDPSLIQDIRLEKDNIGFAAECAVVEYERDRVGSELAQRVEHVAIRNAAAGFDVESTTVLPTFEVVPRCIEVKAVSAKDFCFYWSANEVAVAEVLGSWYYLYLLPVGSNGQLRRDLLRIVCDPHNAVLTYPDQWSVESSVLRCRLQADE